MWISIGVGIAVLLIITLFQTVIDYFGPLLAQVNGYMPVSFYHYLLMTFDLGL